MVNTDFLFFVQKLQERQSILKKLAMPMPEKEKEKWSKVMCADVMSSEGSDVENNQIVLVKELPWRSQLVSDFFGSLDDRIGEGKTSQAIRQRKKRVMSVVESNRMPVPNLPKWALQ